MARNPRLSDWQSPHEISDALLFVQKNFDDLTTPRIGQRLKH